MKAWTDSTQSVTRWRRAHDDTVIKNLLGRNRRRKEQRTSRDATVRQNWHSCCLSSHNDSFRYVPESVRAARWSWQKHTRSRFFPRNWWFLRYSRSTCYFMELMVSQVLEKYLLLYGTDGFLGTREVPVTLWNPTVCYRSHNPLSILNRINSVYPLPCCVLQSILILPCILRSFKQSLSFGLHTLVPVYICIYISRHMCHIPRPSHTSWSDHPDNIC